MAKQKWMKAAVLLALLLVLCGCGDEEVLEPLETYEIGEESITALDTVLEEKSGKLTDVATAEDAEDGSTTYVYDKMKESGSSVERYVQTLLEENEGFVISDEEDNEVEAPDYTAEEGTVLLHKHFEESDGEQSTGYVELRVSWTKKGCNVDVYQVNLHDEEEEEKNDGITLTEVSEFFAACDPSELGLSGESMEQYSIYPLDALVNVDGVPSFRVNICSRREGVDTNEIEGVYFLSGDRAHIYRLNTETQEVELIR